MEFQPSHLCHEAERVLVATWRDHWRVGLVMALVDFLQEL